MAQLNLYGLERSVYTRIARLALEEKAAPYKLHEVEIFGPGGAPPEHLARHPFGRIPVLEHGGFWLYETSAIVRYIDEAFPGPQLQPADLRARARMNQLISILDAYAYRAMVWGVFVERMRMPVAGRSPDEAKIADAVIAARACLEAIAALFEGPFFVGARVSLADLHAFPMLRLLSLAPEGHALLAAHGALQQWFTTMLARDSAVRTASPYESSP